MADKSTPTAAEYIDEGSRWNVGAGIVTMALFPFALPGIVLIAALALPFLAVGLVGALLVGLVVLPLRAVRALTSRRRDAEKPAADRVATASRPRANQPAAHHGL
jgi:hypothetical protein